MASQDGAVKAGVNADDELEVLVTLDAVVHMRVVNGNIIATNVDVFSQERLFEISPFTDPSVSVAAREQAILKAQDRVNHHYWDLTVELDE